MLASLTPSAFYCQRFQRWISNGLPVWIGLIKDSFLAAPRENGINKTNDRYYRR